MPATRPSVLLPSPSSGMPSHLAAWSAVGFVSGIPSLQELLRGAGRIDLSLDDAVEELSDRRIVADGRLQSPSHPGRRQLQHLVAEVPRPPFVQGPLRFDVGAVLADLRGELGNPLRLGSLRPDDRDLPGAG